MEKDTASLVNMALAWFQIGTVAQISYDLRNSERSGVELNVRFFPG